MTGSPSSPDWTSTGKKKKEEEIVTDLVRTGSKQLL